MQHAAAFFETSPFAFAQQAFINPAEYVLAVSEQCVRSGADTVVDSQQLVDYFEARRGELHMAESSFSAEQVSDLTQSATMMHLGEAPPTPYKSSAGHQLATLLYRYFLRTVRTRLPLRVSFVR